jgi:4-amino-4-deoxy-L-arabinose transferase-like glycosyltransferase
MKRVLIVPVILLIAGFLRFYNISVSPGYEWDEPVYAQISAKTMEVGFPNNKGDGNVNNMVPYLYHPPFDFYLKGAWFTQVGAIGPSGEITAGRVLSGIESLIGLIIAYFCLLEIAGSTGALIGLLLLATDGWLIYTARLNLIESGMMPWGMFGIWMYVLATKREKIIYYLLAGFFLAFAAVYKHTGIPFLIVPIINFAITRKDRKKHLLLVYTMCTVVLLYLIIMLFIWNDYYRFQTWVQIERTLGNIGSRGLNYGLGAIITAVYQTYWVFVVTVATIIGVGIIGLYRFIRAVTGKKMFNSVLLSWAISAFIFLAAIALKAPHYLIIVLIPGYMFIASELGQFGEGRAKRIIVTVIVGIALTINLYTWIVRFVEPHDNALLETYKYFQTVPVTAHVLDDDCVSTGIDQPSYNLDRYSSDQGIKDAAPNYVVMYSSITQKPPVSQALQGLLLQSKLVERFQGFKEVIEIYQVQ